MSVLVLFERSGVVREEFRKLGHDAWPCDIEPAEDGSPYHIQIDFNDLKRRGREFWIDWDTLIAHPECTHLSVSGAHRFAEKRKDGRQQKAIDTFMDVVNLPVRRKCVENPVSIMSTIWRKPNQIIQPYQFGDDASKKTCIWLDGLPNLIIDPARYVWPRWVCTTCGHVSRGEHTSNWRMSKCPECRVSTHVLPRWANQTDSGQNRLGPSPTRAMDRARTYPGPAKAMGKQWGGLNLPMPNLLLQGQLQL